MTTKAPAKPASKAKARSTPSKPSTAKRRTRDSHLKTKASQRAAEVFVDALTSQPQTKGAIARAARIAYPAQSHRSSRVTGSRLLADPIVQEMVERRLERAREAARMTREEAVGILAQHASASIGDVLNERGEFDLQDARKRGVDHLLREITVTERHHTKRRRVGKGKAARYVTDTHTRTTTKYKIHDPQKAMDLQSELMGWKKQAMKNPIDSARESFAIMRARPEYKDLNDATVAQLAQESHGLPKSAIADILAGTVRR